MNDPAATPERQRLPPGRHGLERAFVIANQRDRILDAVAHEVADKGYAEVTVADVIARAGVSSKTFYKLFRDMVDCFLAAYDAAIEILAGRVAAACGSMPEATPERARAVLAAVLEVLAREPAFARMCVVEAPAAGPEARERYGRVLDGFRPLVERIENYPAAARHRGRARPPAVTAQALIGGIAWVISQQIVAGQTERLPELLPELAYFLLAPFLGEQAATKCSLGAGHGHAGTRLDDDQARPPDGVKALSAGRSESPGGRIGGYAAEMPSRTTGTAPNANAKSARRRRRGRRPGREGSPPLTRQAIVDAAFRVADRDGLRAVSIRRLAAELGVGPMRLYTHVADKAELLALIADEFVALMLVEEEPPSEDWREALSETARRSRAAFAAHPWALEVFAQHPSLGPNAVRYARQQARAVAGLGLEPTEVWTILAIVDDYLIGNALRTPTTGVPQHLRDALSPGDPAELPELGALAAVDRARATSKLFEIGLQAVLDGVERRFVTLPAQPRRSARAHKPRAPRTAGKR